MHELEMTRDQVAAYLTLTYADENLPENGNLNPRHWVLFAKKLRAKYGPFRFLMCGEYGSEENTNRCHYHAILFGLEFPDQVHFKDNEQGQPLFISAALSKIWTHGTHLIGAVSFDSVGYVAGYINKKVNGRNAAAHYSRVNTTTGECYDQVPEFGRMSRGDNSGDTHTGYGLGHSWIEKYHPEVYPRDEVLVNGKLASPPDYYDRWYEQHYPAKMAAIKIRRTKNASKYEEDNSPARLAVKKQVFTAKYAHYKRK